MITRILLHIIILCSLSFYNVTFLGTLARYFNLLGVVLIIFLIFLFIIYGESGQFKKHFTWPIILILIGVLLSTGFCYIFYNQSIFYTFWEQKEMFLYLGYFMVHLMKPNPKEIERIIGVYAIVFIVFYFVQYMIYPVEIFNVDMWQNRGTIRIALPGITFLIIGYFLFFQTFLQTNKFLHFLRCFLILLIAVLLGGRQLISVLVLMTIIILILSKRIKNRFLIYLLVIIGLIPLYFIFYNIFHELIKATFVNVNRGSEDIRLKALRYFLLDSFPNTISYLTGNGAPSETSNYGRGISTIAGKYRFFLSDIGIIGNYYLYGMFFLVGVLLIFFRITLLKISSNHKYLQYFFASLFIMLPMGGGFAYGELIFPLILFLYLIDVSNYQIKESLRIKSTS